MKLLTAFFQTMFLLSATMAANLQSATAPERSTPVAVGDKAPDFKLEDQNGHKITLFAARDKSPVVLIFYRGYW